MKILKNSAFLVLAGTLSLTLGSCADLGFGVDVDSGGVGPYWYGDGVYSNQVWNNPWYYYPGPAPIYGPGPVIDYSPAFRPPVRPVPNPPQVIIPSRPAQTVIPSRPSGGNNRPGNMGRPQQNTTPTVNLGDLNMNRGR